MSSWVETTCPPGWAVRTEAPNMVCAYQRDWLRGNVETRDGDVKWCDTVEEANRLAWERWALEVLGEMYWSRRSDFRPFGVWPKGDGGAWLAVDADDRGYGLELNLAPDCDPGPVVLVSDPVEAIARLAALKLAVYGPGVAQ